jgi:hypothetical protein
MTIPRSKGRPLNSSSAIFSCSLPTSTNSAGQRSRSDRAICTRAPGISSSALSIPRRAANHSPSASTRTQSRARCADDARQAADVSARAASLLSDRAAGAPSRIAWGGTPGHAAAGNDYPRPIRCRRQALVATHSPTPTPQVLRSRATRSRGSKWRPLFPYPAHARGFRGRSTPRGPR